MNGQMLILMTKKINNVFFIQTENKRNEPINTVDLSEWEYVEEEILAVNVDTSDVLEAKLKEIENLKSQYFLRSS